MENDDGHKTTAHQDTTTQPQDEQTDDRAARDNALARLAHAPIHKLAAMLDDRTRPWFERDAALAHITDKLRSAAAAAADSAAAPTAQLDVRALAPALAAQLPDLRSRVAKSAFDALLALSAVAGEQQVEVLDEQIPPRQPRPRCGEQRAELDVYRLNQPARALAAAVATGGQAPR